MSVAELESRLLTVSVSDNTLTEDYHVLRTNGQIIVEQPQQVAAGDPDATGEHEQQESSHLADDFNKDPSGSSSQSSGVEAASMFDDDEGMQDDMRSPRVGDKTQICFDFTKGLCSRGEKCKFSHDIPTIVSFNSKEKGICFDYLRNQCYRGLLCRFSHDLTNIAQQYQVYNNAAKTRATTSICYDFVKGVCQRGSQCKYSHDLSMIAKIGRNNGTNSSNEVCHDFLRGRCTRGAACKYSHNVAFLGAQGLVAAVSGPNGTNTVPMGTAGLNLGIGGLQNGLSGPGLGSGNLSPYASGNYGAAVSPTGVPPPSLLSMTSGLSNGLQDVSNPYGAPLQQRMMNGGGLGDGLAGATDLAAAWARATQGGSTNGMLSSFAAPQLQTARTDPTAVIQAMNNNMRLMGGGSPYQSPADMYASISNQAALAHARQQVSMQGLLAGHLNKTASDMSSQLAALRNNAAFNEFLESAAASHASEMDALRHPGGLHRQQSAPGPMPDGLLQSLLQQQQQQDAADNLAAARLAMSQGQQLQQQHPTRMMESSPLNRQLSGHMGGQHGSPMMDASQLSRQLSGQVGGPHGSPMMDTSQLTSQLSRQLSGQVGGPHGSPMMETGQLTSQLSRQLSSQMGGQHGSPIMDPTQLNRQLSSHMGSQPLMDAAQLTRQMSAHVGSQHGGPPLMDASQLSRQLSSQLGVSASSMMEPSQLSRQLSSQLIGGGPMMEPSALSRQMSGNFPPPLSMHHMNGHMSPQLNSPMAAQVSSQLSSPMAPHSPTQLAPTQPQPIPTTPKTGHTGPVAAGSAPGALNLTDVPPLYTAGVVSNSYGDGYLSGNDTVAGNPADGAPVPFQRIKEIWNRPGSYGEV